ncbi:MAG: PD-(D/E)XK nuclease family protein [Nitriliruptoraceae bacterium]|nr:PD-(D/E)XK nuclease family protein [Nitriliruptoraceae bacterium]
MDEPSPHPTEQAGPTTGADDGELPLGSDGELPLGSDGELPLDANGALRLIDVEGAPPGTFGTFEPDTPPLVDGQGRVRLSFSRVDRYGNCPRSFRYAYVDRLPQEPSPHLSFGTSIHSALEAFYDRKLPRMPTEEELLAALYEHWDTSGFVALEREEQLSYYRHAQDVLRRYHQRVAPTYRLPAATEAWFSMPIEHEAVVVGSIDRVDVDDDGRFHIIDYKTNRKVQDRRRVAGSRQLAIYALACRHLYGALPATVSLDFVVPGVAITVPLEELDLEDARQAVLATARAVRQQAFEPTPNRLCDWCDYRAVCPAWQPGAAGTQVLGEAVAELHARRRELQRGVRELRELEAGVARLREELLEPDEPGRTPGSGPRASG